MPPSRKFRLPASGKRHETVHAAGSRTNDDWLETLRSRGARADAAYAELGRVLRRVLLRALAGRGGLHAAAVDDFVQDALIRIAANLDSFRGDCRFTTWANAVALRTALSALRRAHWRDVPLEEAQINALPTTTEVGDSPETCADRSRTVQALYGVIERDLTERQRWALLAELRGMPQDIMVERLGTNRNALYKLIHDARKALRAGLEADGFGIDDVRALFDE